MIRCKLGEKTYSVDYISGRALREIEPAFKMYGKIAEISDKAIRGENLDNEADFTIPNAMDVMVRWFCVLFNNQFTPDDVYDSYPVDNLMRDIVTALLAVQSQTTDVLSDFPMPASEGQK